MKQNNKKPTNERCTAAGLMPVRFEFMDQAASSVCVAGSFNDWQPESKAMYSSGDGRWWKETVLAPGIYEYCLVVDGRWMPDPMASDSVANPYGGRNSVLRVATSPDAEHLASAENAPFPNGATKESQPRV